MTGSKMDVEGSEDFLEILGKIIKLTSRAKLLKLPMVDRLFSMIQLELAETIIARSEDGSPEIDRLLQLLPQNSASRDSR
jgi:hypothetical protein